METEQSLYLGIPQEQTLYIAHRRVIDDDTAEPISDCICFCVSESEANKQWCRMELMYPVTYENAHVRYEVTQKTCQVLCGYVIHKNEFLALGQLVISVLSTNITD